MDAAVIKKNLATRAKLAKTVAENARQDQIDAGHNADRIDKIAGRAEAPTTGAAFTDAGKEARYQAWKKAQGQ
jgi:hypothetical protein